MERDFKNECYHCKHKREVPGNAHISCNNPDKNMRGYEHGIRNGWFMYPLLFDPVWKLDFCSNYSNADELNNMLNNSLNPSVSPTNATNETNAR